MCVYCQAKRSPNTGVVDFVKIAYGDFGNPDPLYEIFVMKGDRNYGQKTHQ